MQSPNAFSVVLVDFTRKRAVFYGVLKGNLRKAGDFKS